MWPTNRLLAGDSKCIERDRSIFIIASKRSRFKVMKRCRSVSICLFSFGVFPFCWLCQRIYGWPFALIRLIHAVYAHNKLAAKKPWTRVALSCIWIHLALFFPSPPVLCLTFSSFFLVLLLVRRSYMDVRLHPRRISSGIFLVLFALLLLFRLRLSTSSLFSDFNWHTHTRRRSKNTRPFTTVSSSVTAVRWFFNISTAERKKLTWNAHMRTASEKLLRKKDKKDEPYTEILCVCVCYLEQWGKENPIWEYRKKTSWLSSTSLICIWYLHWLFPVSCCFYLRAAHDDPLGGGRGQTVNCISLSLS